MIEKLTRFHDRAMATFIIDDVCGHEPADAEAFLQFSRWVEETVSRANAARSRA